MYTLVATYFFYPCSEPQHIWRLLLISPCFREPCESRVKYKTCFPRPFSHPASPRYICQLLRDKFILRNPEEHSYYFLKTNRPILRHKSRDAARGPRRFMSRNLAVQENPLYPVEATRKAAEARKIHFGALLIQLKFVFLVLGGWVNLPAENNTNLICVAAPNTLI